jgi:hypothetical protein
MYVVFSTGLSRDIALSFQLVQESREVQKFRETMVGFSALGIEKILRERLYRVQRVMKSRTRWNQKGIDQQGDLDIDVRRIKRIVNT